MAETKTFAVTGMSCGHCESAIREEVGELQGIAEISVSAQTGNLAVTLADGAEVTDDDIVAAVDEAGYEAVRV